MRLRLQKYIFSEQKNLHFYLRNQIEVFILFYCGTPIVVYYKLNTDDMTRNLQIKIQRKLILSLLYSNGV